MKNKATYRDDGMPATTYLRKMLGLTVEEWEKLSGSDKGMLISMAEAEMMETGISPKA